MTETVYKAKAPYRNGREEKVTSYILQATNQ